MNAEVGVGGLEDLIGAVCPLVGVAHDEDVMTTAEGVPEDSDGAHDDLGVVSTGHVAGRAIEVPLGAVSNRVDLALNCPALGAEGDAAAIDPDVFGDGDVVDFFPAALKVDVLVVEGEVCVVSHF